MASGHALMQSLLFGGEISLDREELRAQEESAATSLQKAKLDNHHKRRALPCASQAVLSSPLEVAILALPNSL